MRRYLFPLFLIAIPVLAACLWLVSRPPTRDVVPQDIPSNGATGARSANLATPHADAPIPFFPWPPPPASTRMTIEGVFADRARFPTMKQAAAAIQGALRQAGFGDWGYFSLPDEEGGFGLVTRIEQIDDDGKPLPGTARWLVRPYAAATMTHLQSLTRIRRPLGRYRVFVFVLSAKPTTDNPTERATMPLAYEWNQRGLPHLNQEIAASPLTDRHALTVRVYEFEQTDKIASVFNKSSQWSAEEHLRLAGIVLPGAP